MRKIIIDCDNTFSIEGCDIDDGLAIIYSLAQLNTEIVGINTTFGNNKLDIVHSNTLKFMEDIACPDIAINKGATSDYRDNQAAQFLVDMANKYRGEISIIGLGSLTNLYHAWKLDNDFYNKLDKISLMGGLTEPLIINGKRLDELNFSCNHEAALNVLQKGKDITIATGNTCLDGFFTLESFDQLKGGNDFEKWLYRKGLYWFDREEKVFGNKGVYKWDVFAATALLNPEYFIDNRIEISPDEESIKKGFLLGKGEPRYVNIPRIKNIDEYIEHVYSQYRIFGEQREIGLFR